MPSLELAAGQVLTAAHTNTYWMRQVVATGLSSARPTGYEGRAVYDTDTDALMVYASATTGWRPPWNLPWGHVAYKYTAADTTLASGATNTGVTTDQLVFAAVKNRRYRVFGQARVVGDAGVGTMHYNVQILAGASGFAVSGGSATLSAMTTDNEDVVIPFDQVFDASLTQNVTIAPFMWAASNGGVWRAGATLYVEDIGPAAGPA